MHRRSFLGLAGSFGLASVLPSGAASASDEPSPEPFLDRSRIEARNRDRSTVVCQNGLVCTSQPLASMAGIDVLKSGGNCIDAAIAANAVLGVTEPASCGIGGDLFVILWHEKDRKLYGLNASGRSPAAWTLDKAYQLGLDRIPRRSVLSWSVPGCVDGWAMLSERFGNRSLAQVLEPAIAYAEDGFPISPIISTHFEWKTEEAPHMAQVYHPEGRPPAYGEVFRNSDLARSLRLIAENGKAAFYQGEIATAIVQKSQAMGGHMTMADLESHVGNWIDPVSVSYRGWDVWELPPNGQGIAALQILNILEQFDIGGLEPNSAEHLHLLIEAKKLAFEDRARFYADPDFAEVPTEWLISKEYAKERAATIDPKRASLEVGHGDPELDSDTVYLTAADAEGNMVSFIQSIYSGFGSTICPDGVGFPIQNRGQAFALSPDHPNRLEPSKRPFHTIIPAFMTREGRPVMAFGVMGGDFQPQGHAQVVMNMVDFGMSPQQATDQPRLAHSGSSDPWPGRENARRMERGGELVFEHGFQDGVKVALAERGHRISERIQAHGGYQAIWRRDNPRVYFGGSDPRKDGVAIGW